MFGGIPFEHMGGMPGGMGGMGGPSADVDTTKLYETLEVDKDADAKEIKKAYRRLSRTHHPDKGGDEHKFKEINAGMSFVPEMIVCCLHCDLISILFPARSPLLDSLRNFIRSRQEKTIR